MPVVLYRVDERLIHGQVVVGWGARLSPDRIVVVDDDIAASDWEQELYMLGLPPQIEGRFEDVATARAVASTGVGRRAAGDHRARPGQEAGAALREGRGTGGCAP
jgi:mannose/fructose/N-acetylgalactosamine-specific phosphotransferase system component IIB